MTVGAACSYDVRMDRVQWRSLDDFCQSPWTEGVHVINLEPGRHVDVFVGGDIAGIPSGRSLPVFFSGAVVPRQGLQGPFFSGGGIAERLSTPFLAFSDPVVDATETLSLAWYTGRANEGFQATLTRILRVAQVRYGELVLVGGSGGGFAAVLYADRIGSSALVWNPQTDLLLYAPPSVRSYLAEVSHMSEEQVHSASTESRGDVLLAGGVQHSITSESAPGAKRLVYLQNASDWHVGVHARPFIRARGLEYHAQGIWGRQSRDVALQLSEFSSGHTPPPYPVILRGIDLLLDAATKAEDVLMQLHAENLLPPVDESTAPRDLLDYGSQQIMENVRVIVTRLDGGSLQARLSWGSLPRGYGGITAIFRTAEGVELIPRDADPYSVDVAADRNDAGPLLVTLSDGLGQQLGQLRAGPA